MQRLSTTIFNNTFEFELNKCRSSKAKRKASLKHVKVK